MKLAATVCLFTPLMLVNGTALYYVMHVKHLWMKKIFVLLFYGSSVTENLLFVCFMIT